LSPGAHAISFVPAERFIDNAELGSVAVIAQMGDLLHAALMRDATAATVAGEINPYVV
jgi:hypothetical protein